MLYTVSRHADGMGPSLLASLVTGTSVFSLNGRIQNVLETKSSWIAACPLLADSGRSVRTGGSRLRIQVKPLSAPQSEEHHRLRSKI